jgi:hypothetical protein
MHLSVKIKHNCAHFGCAYLGLPPGDLGYAVVAPIDLSNFAAAIALSAGTAIVGATQATGNPDTGVAYVLERE